MNPPIATRIPHPHTLHGDVRPDDYYWLRERNNPEVIRYLEAENRYGQAVLEPLQALEEQLFQDIRSHIQETDAAVPVQHGPYFYYHRLVEGRQYPLYARRRAASRAALEGAPEEVILDQNERAADREFLSITVLRPSPDHQRLAFLENTDGSDRYTLYIRDLTTGAILPDVIPDVYLYGSVEWDAAGEYLFYVSIDDTQRPYRLWRHRLGQAGTDTLLYEERDHTFTLHLRASLSGRYLLALSRSTLTHEVRYLDASRPEADWSVFAPRVRGVEYDLEHWQDQFLILTNEGAENFQLLACPVADTGREHWRPLIGPSADRYLTGVSPFADCLLVEGREDGLTQLWVYKEGALRRVPWHEPLYTVGVADNREYDPEEILIGYQSLLTPVSTYALDPDTLTTKLLKRDPVPGGYDPAQYVQERVWTPAADGVQIPVSVVYRRGARDHGPAPCWLDGYGSYGASNDPDFVASRLPLLDRGVIFAIAHVRGGSEMGRRWYLDGKLLHKRNTFTDFIAVAEGLAAAGYTAPDRLAAEGRSAGGLLMGAIVNMRPDLFRVVVAGVPFVDVLTTMMDDSIPLTSLEWDEWGNPRDPEYYAYMRTYSPYDNVAPHDYPHLFVQAGLNDPRVGYFEPAKWVARLRVTKTDQNSLVLWTHMGAGHGGSSGRYDRWRERARQYAFALDKLGIRA